jgi:hypothetical protein
MRMERYHHVIVVCHLAESACMSEIARVLVRLNHVASFIVNAEERARACSPALPLLTYEFDSFNRKASEFPHQVT